jgi:hypothetical protein
MPKKQTYEKDVTGGVQTLDKCKGVNGLPTDQTACDAETAAYNTYVALRGDKETIDARKRAAKKGWYTSADKLLQYNEEIGLEAEAKAKVVTDKWNDEFTLLYNNIENNYHHIKSLEKYCPGAEKLDMKYLSLIKGDNVEAKKLIEKANIDQRMAEFYNNNDYYNDILYYIKWLYWVLFLLCVIMLFMSGQYKNVKTYLFFIVLAAFPTVILNNVITWANTNISQVKINTLYFIFLIIGSLTVSLLYYSGNMAMPTEMIKQEIK